MSARAARRARAAKDEQLVGEPDAPLFVAGVDPATGDDRSLVVTFRDGRVVDVADYDGPRAVPDTIPAPPPDFEGDGVARGPASPRAEGHDIR